MKRTYAIDFETYYDSKVSVKDLGAEAYTRHPDYYAGMVSIVGEDVRFVGKPKDAPWHKLAGGVWIAHNVQFDRWVTRRLQEDGTIPQVYPSRWVDTTAIPAYLQVSRDLANASRVLLGKTVDKAVRTKMSGRHFEELPADRWQILCDYALKDSDLCYELYKTHAHKLPDHEWKLSELTVDQADFGVQINEPLLATYLSTVRETERSLLSQIPWRGDYAALSQSAFRQQLASDGIVDVPKSTQASSPEWVEWSNRRSNDFAYINAFVQLRRLKKHLATLQNISNRVDSDGVLHFSMKYCGSRVTGRWAGDAGINMQNLPKDELFGAKIRNLFVARPGHKFIIADLSQIEPRCLAEVCDDRAFLDLVNKGMDVYEAHARSSMGYSDERPLKTVDPAMRQIAKARVLGLGYGCGAERFRDFAALFGMDYTEEEAVNQVRAYRSTNPRITDLWHTLNSRLRRSKLGDLSIPLPTGRNLMYYDIREEEVKIKGEYRTALRAITERGRNSREMFWGSKLVENMIQAIARDVFADAMLRIDAGGIRTCWHVHDELICEVPSDQANDAKEFIEQEMSRRNPALPAMPIAVDAHIADYYDK